MTGLEAEAMIKKYGGDLHPPVEPAPLAFTTHSAGLFCDSLPPDPGLNLAPDFVREYDRIASTDLDRRTARVIADNFRFSKDSSEKYLTQRRPLRWRSERLWPSPIHLRLRLFERRICDGPEFHNYHSRLRDCRFFPYSSLVYSFGRRRWA